MQEVEVQTVEKVEVTMASLRGMCAGHDVHAIPDDELALETEFSDPKWPGGCDPLPAHLMAQMTKRKS